MGCVIDQLLCSKSCHFSRSYQIGAVRPLDSSAFPGLPLYPIPYHVQRKSVLCCVVFLSMLPALTNYKGADTGAVKLPNCQRIRKDLSQNMHTIYPQILGTSDGAKDVYQENASSTKSILLTCCRARTALLTSSLNAPDPQTDTPIAPTWFSISRSMRVSIFGRPGNI